MLNVVSSECVVIRPYDRRVMPVAEVGSDIEQRYRKRYDINGNAEFIPVEEFNVREFINSFRTGCSLRAILERTQLLPTREKIGYLQQSEDGFSADMTEIPKDGTEAFIALRDLAMNHPDIVSRMNAGESFESIIKDKFGEKVEPAPTVVPGEAVKNDESEEK